ncbi:MAG: tyrosine-type recombinase/integrase [Oligoflexia bacterium]|nr:tyrosine-type recombinase/integrase [Oligoflexia bacterium]
MILLEAFLRDLQFGRNCSSHTISAYKRDLDYYKEFSKNKKKNIQEFYEFLDKKKLSARSQARIISCLRSYFRFLQRQGKRCVEIKYLSLPKVQHKIPHFISLKDFKALWKASKEDSEHLSLRNELVLSFLYGLGCRVSELINLNIQDFNETSAWISILGKGNKERLLPLPTKLHQLLIVYLKNSRPYFSKTEKACLIFNNKGNRPSRVDIWRWLKKWSLKAGFDTVKNPHSFRHGCATGLLERGADLRTIQKLLGHSNIQTTQIYTSVNPKKLKSAIKKHHPLSQLKHLI